MTDRTVQELLEENSSLQKRIQELEHSVAELREAAEKQQLEHELLVDMLKYHPVGVYRLRVFTSEEYPDDAWSSPDAPPYRLELVNDRFCEILGITRDTFKTMPNVVVGLVHPEEKEEFIRRNEESNVRLSPFLWEGRLIIDGQNVWVHFESLPRLIADGDVLWTGILYDITERIQQEEEMKKLVASLQNALNEIKTLRGIVPICANCKKIRNDKGFWDHVEVYVTEHTDAQFSHGICPECAKKLYPDFYENTEMNGE